MVELDCEPRESEARTMHMSNVLSPFSPWGNHIGSNLREASSRENQR